MLAGIDNVQHNAGRNMHRFKKKNFFDDCSIHITNGVPKALFDLFKFTCYRNEFLTCGVLIRKGSV